MTSTPRLATTALLLALACLTAPGARADFSLSGRSALVSLNMPNPSQEGIYLRKHQLRRDLTERGRTYSYLYDLEKRQFTVIDHLMRLAEIRPMDDTQAAASGVPQLKLDLDPTPRKQALGHWSCQEHTLSASLPTELGTEKATLRLAGQIWLATRTDEQREFAPFLKAVEAREFFIGTPEANGRLTTQNLGINEVLRRVLPKGMLCAANLEMRYEGNGPMADLGRRMATRLSLVFEKLSDTPLADSVFAIPAGYRVIKR